MTCQKHKFDSFEEHSSIESYKPGEHATASSKMRVALSLVYPNTDGIHEMIRWSKSRLKAGGHQLSVRFFGSSYKLSSFHTIH